MLIDSNKKVIVYWIAQIMGWGFYTALLLISVLTFSPGRNNEMKVIMLQFIIGFTCLLVSHGLRYFFKKFKWKGLSLKKLIPRVLFSNIVAAITAQLIIHSIMLTVLKWQTVRPIVWSEIPVYTFNVFLMFSVWSVFYFSYQFFKDSERTKVDKLKVEAALKDAELIALKAQINPHFLFNALNNIKALILENPEKARDMIGSLSDLLRYSVQFSNTEKVPLASELEIVKEYLQLESIQYEERLKYRLEIDERTLVMQIPPMVIQLLVENAIKHGISQLKNGGSIKITTQAKQDDLLIIVENTGNMAASCSDGIGIRNALDRIRLLFDKEPNFRLFEDNGKVQAQLIIPVL